VGVIAMRLTVDALRALLDEYGWRVRYASHTTLWRASSPLCDREYPTPDHIRNSRVGTYPFDTYSPLRQVVWSTVNGQFIVLCIREAAVPWVGVLTRTATRTAVVAYIEQYGQNSTACR